MVEAMVRDCDIDRSRVFVAGLSAGGAMTSVMLATYPETFAAGGIVAGLPYSTATNINEALECMSKARDRSPSEWGDLGRAASLQRGPWPRVSVWHGGADTLVKWENAVEIVDQWLGDGAFKPEDSGKLARLRELAEPIAARQDKLLVFTQFREMTGPLSSFLAGVFGRPGLALHGETIQ